MTRRTTTKRTTTLSPATSKRNTTQPPSSTDSSCGRLQRGGLRRPEYTVGGTVSGDAPWVVSLGYHKKKNGDYM